MRTGYQPDSRWSLHNSVFFDRISLISSATFASSILSPFLPFLLYTLSSSSLILYSLLPAPFLTLFFISFHISPLSLSSLSPLFPLFLTPQDPQFSLFSHSRLYSSLPVFLHYASILCPIPLSLPVVPFFSLVFSALSLLSLLSNLFSLPSSSPFCSSFPSSLIPSI